MFGSPAQWANTAAADALVERIPDPLVAVRILLSMAAGRGELLQRAAVKAASVKHVVDRGLAGIAVVQAAVAAGQTEVAFGLMAAVDHDLALHLREVCAVELARRGELRQAWEAVEALPPVRRDRAAAAVSAEQARRDPELARDLAERVAGASARVSVLLAGGLVDEALAVPLDEIDAVGIEKADVARTELVAALARRGDFEQAIELIRSISGRRRRYLARWVAARSALPVAGALQLLATFSEWEQSRCIADLVERAESVDAALTIADAAPRRPEVLRKLAVSLAGRGAVAAAIELMDEFEPDVAVTLRVAEAVDRETAIAMITDPAVCTPYSWENPADRYHVVPGARAAAAHGELAHVLAAVETARAWDRGDVLRKAGLTAAVHGHPRTALALAGRLDSERDRQHQTGVVLGATAARGDLSEALALLGEYVPREDQADALAVIGRALVRAGRVPTPELGAMASHALVMAAAVGGQLSAALAMASGIAGEQAARKFGHSAAVHRRDLVIDICCALAAVGAFERVIEAASSLPPKYRDIALRLAGRTAVRHGHLEGGTKLWWLIGGPRGNDAVEVAVVHLAAGVAMADTVGDDEYRSRERAYRDIAVLAAYRGLLPEAAAVVARIEPAEWALASAWRNITGHLNAEQRRTFADAYLTARAATRR
ncbi:hypothetical protein ACIA49_28270 [Kribbella sp. NPDC051587]|uniref:hypothetical protein n=1 Tax=Kribbella sp. NPDC051587 TaxID=3364119 RepID=UPI0037891AA8